MKWGQKLGAVMLLIGTLYILPLPVSEATDGFLKTMARVGLWVYAIPCFIEKLPRLLSHLKT